MLTGTHEPVNFCFLVYVRLKKWLPIQNKKIDGGKFDSMMKAMGHSLYQAYLMNSGLDNSSPMASGPWGEQIKMMVGEFGPALKEMGLME